MWPWSTKPVLKGQFTQNENSVIVYSPSSSSKPAWMCLFCWTQRKIFWRMWETEQFWGTIDFHSIFFPDIWKSILPQKQPGYKLYSKYLPLCSTEQTHSNRIGTTWGWVNDDRIFIFGWTVPLSSAGIFIAIAKNTLYGLKQYAPVRSISTFSL